MEDKTYNISLVHEGAVWIAYYEDLVGSGETPNDAIEDLLDTMVSEEVL